MSGARFDDTRLIKRFRALLGQLSERPGASIPFACQNRASANAAYRFLPNPRVGAAHVLNNGHFSATRDRFVKLNVDAAANARSRSPMMLVLHDTTALTLRREDATRMGMIGKLADYTRVRRVMMHSALVIAMQGLPLGLAAAKFWTRSHFKGTNALKRKLNPTRIPIEQKESYRWLHNVRESTQLLCGASRCVHIEDRESDTYELFFDASALGTHFLLRTKKRGEPIAASTAQYRLAELGGYLARTRDPPPGDMAIWRGLQRLPDIALRFKLKARLVGN